MKKMNLSLMKQHLTRDEMRAISGGSGGSSIYCKSTTHCTSGCTEFESQSGRWICNYCCN